MIMSNLDFYSIQKDAQKEMKQDYLPEPKLTWKEGLQLAFVLVIGIIFIILFYAFFIAGANLG